VLLNFAHVDEIKVAMINPCDISPVDTLAVFEQMTRIHNIRKQAEAEWKSPPYMIGGTIPISDMVPSAWCPRV
jgi:hypothetical protein